MTTVIVDYGSGNLHSAGRALLRAAAEVDGGKVVVSADPDLVARADRVVLPGVGAFAECRAGLEAVDGMVAAIESHVASGKPFFGICVGMQLMASEGHEHGVTPGFGWVPGKVLPIAPADPGLKVPHMGWNTIAPVAHPVFEGIPTGEHVYFVHSYHLVADDPAHVAATCGYGQTITAAVARDAMIGTQFHPEKSQGAGLRILGNFLRWRP